MSSLSRVARSGLLILFAVSIAPPAHAVWLPDGNTVCAAEPGRLDLTASRSEDSVPARMIPREDAGTRERLLRNAALRVMEPSEPSSVADRWLRSLEPGWFGFAVQVADRIAARAVLERRGIRVLAPRRGGATLLVVDPDQTGGTLVQYVTAPVLP